MRIITLFDTPLSLNNNYRHVAVNSMWQLEGMDFYLISDEEIIQVSYTEKSKITAVPTAFYLEALYYGCCVLKRMLSAQL